MMTQDTAGHDEISPDMKNIIRDLSGKTMLRRKAARRRLIIQGEKNPQRLIRLLNSPVKKVRWEAIKVLVSLENKTLIPVFLNLLNDDLSDIRWKAAEGLINLGPQSIIPVIERILTEEDSPLFRDSAYHALSELAINREKEIVSPLLICLGNHYVSHQELKSTANEVLTELKKSRGIPQ